MERIRWILTAGLSAFACHFAVQYATPIDRALPLLAVFVTLLAWASYSEVMIGVPLLMVAEIAIADEGMRLLAIGLVVCVATAASAVARRPWAAVSTLLVAILLLRWIPVHDVQRELFLLAIALLLFLVLGRTPFAVAVAVVTALVTPAVPLRTFAFPLIVLAVAIAARAFGMPRLRLVWPSTVVVAFAVMFFAWSGIVARAFPYFLKRTTPAQREFIVTVPQGQSKTFDVPDGKTRIVMSGANVAHLRRGAEIGRIDPGNVTVRIGDVADWGYMRREQDYGSHNPLPRDPAGTIRGYGYDAWVDGAGRVALPRGARQIRVTADAAALQVEGFE